jgi:hypothetical protein
MKRMSVVRLGDLLAHLTRLILLTETHTTVVKLCWRMTAVSALTALAWLDTSDSRDDCRRDHFN